MSDCPVCLEVCNLVTLDCSHSFCRNCLQNWTTNCPICRQEQSYSINVNNIIMNGVSPINLNISIESPKGTSVGIQENEISSLRNIFGNFNKLRFCQLDRFDKILLQSYSNNSWWIGLIDNISGNKIKLKNTIFLKRSSGSIFYTSPSVRVIDTYENDSFFKISI